MDAYISNTPDPSNESEEPLDDTEAHRERKMGTSPHHRQSSSFMAFLMKLGALEVCRRIPDVLEYMESLQLNLPILLWALCWNEAYPNLVSTTRLALQGQDLQHRSWCPGY